jgi:hypothetical protein
LKDWHLSLTIDKSSTSLVADLHHDNILVRAALRADFATDTGLRVDRDHTAFRVASDRSGGTADHANWVNAVHAGLSELKRTELRTVAYESGIALMRSRASSYTIVATRTAFGVDQQCLSTVHESIID